MDKQAEPPEDFIAALGALALGSRLKRLADALYRDVSETLDASFHGVAPNHVPVLACLTLKGPQTVTELTRHMGVSQPAVTRMVGTLKDLGLVRLDPVSKDQRQSLIVLTKLGEALADRMKSDYWPAVDRAAASLFRDAEGDFLMQIAFVEKALKREPLAMRVQRMIADKRHLGQDG